MVQRSGYAPATAPGGGQWGIKVTGRPDVARVFPACAEAAGRQTWCPPAPAADDLTAAAGGAVTWSAGPSR